MSLITIPAKDIYKYIGENGGILIDLRSKRDFIKGHIPGAVNIPYLELDVSKIKHYKGITLVLYCERGGISLQVGRQLSKMGFSIISVYGGLHAYRGKLSVDE